MNIINQDIINGINRLERMLKLTQAMMMGSLPIERYTQMMDFMWKDKLEEENSE